MPVEDRERLAVLQHVLPIVVHRGRGEDVVVVLDANDVFGGLAVGDSCGHALLLEWLEWLEWAFTRSHVPSVDQLLHFGDAVRLLARRQLVWVRWRARACVLDDA